jgi:hypothetical protein
MSRLAEPLFSLASGESPTAVFSLSAPDNRTRQRGAAQLVGALMLRRIAAALPGGRFFQSMPDSTTQREASLKPANKPLNPHSEADTRTDSSLSHFRQTATVPRHELSCLSKQRGFLLRFSIQPFPTALLLASA